MMQNAPRLRMRGSSGGGLTSQNRTGYGAYGLSLPGADLEKRASGLKRSDDGRVNTAMSTLSAQRLTTRGTL